MSFGEEQIHLGTDQFRRQPSANRYVTDRVRWCAPCWILPDIPRVWPSRI